MSEDRHASHTAAVGHRGTQLTVILAAVSTLGPYTIDAFFPALRAIGEHFQVSNWQAQQLLTVYMLPYAFMSLVHGSVSDALGRKRVLLGCLAIFILASVVCMLAPDFGTLLIGRGVQGAVAGAGSVVGRAVVRDCFSGVQAQRVMSSITMVFALGPALAPIVGGWVHVLYGWRAVFGTMVLFGAVLLLLIWRKLPETHPPGKRARLHLGVLLRNLWDVMRNRSFQLLTGSSCLCFIALHAYLGSAPAIILDHWQMAETSFYALSVPIIGGYSLGAFFSGRLAGRVPPERLTGLGYNSVLVVSTLMLVLQLGFDEAPIPLQQLLLAANAAGLQLMFPTITLRILDLFDHARGTAASAHSFFALLLSALMMGIISPWLSRTMPRLAIAGFLCTLLGWLVWRFVLRTPATRSG